MARPYLPTTLPMEFVEDFGGESEEEESTTKCCQYPRSRLKHKRDRPRDSSTIIEFVQLSKEGQSNTVSAVSSPLLSRKHPENVKNNRKVVSGYEASSSGQSRATPSSPAPLPRDPGGVSPMTRTIVYHEDLGATYVAIPQPPHVITRRRESVAHPLIPRDESILSLCEFERKYEQERGLYQSNGSMSLSSHSLLSPPSEDISLSTLNSSGFKFKTQLLSRYSIELEEENRMLKQLISQHLQPARELENPINAAQKGYCSRENRIKSEEAIEKLKEISNNIEYQRNMSCSMDLKDQLPQTLNCNGALPMGQIQQMSCKDPGDIEISSETSSLSGYRSSEHSDENHEEEDDTVGDILDNAIDTAVFSASEKRNENVHKRSILKSLKPDRSKLFLNVQNGTGSVSPGPSEELPDLECVKTVQAVTANIADTFPYRENKQVPVCFSPATRRKISFMNSDGKVVASSGLVGSHEVIKSSLDPIPDAEDVFTRLRKISDNIGPRTRIPDPGHGSLVFVDRLGRVLATTNVRSPGGQRRQVKTVESHQLSGALPPPPLASPPSPIMVTPASPAWVRMREISRQLEVSGPSLI